MMRNYCGRVNDEVPWPAPYWLGRPLLIRSPSASTVVIRPDSAFTSSTVLTAPARPASDLVTATAAQRGSAPQQQPPQTSFITYAPPLFNRAKGGAGPSNLARLTISTALAPEPNVLRMHHRIMMH